MCTVCSFWQVNQTKQNKKKDNLNVFFFLFFLLLWQQKKMLKRILFNCFYLLFLFTFATKAAETALKSFVCVNRGTQLLAKSGGFWWTEPLKFQVLQLTYVKYNHQFISRRKKSSNIEWLMKRRRKIIDQYQLIKTCIFFSQALTGTSREQPVVLRGKLKEKWWLKLAI